MQQATQLAADSRTTLMSDWQLWMSVSRNLSENTQKLYVRTVETAWAEISDLPDASEEVIERWVQRKGGRAGTVANRITALASFYRFLVKSKYRLDNPTAEMDRPKIHKRLPKPVEDLEAKLKLLDEADARANLWSSDQRRVGETRDMAIFLCYCLAPDTRVLTSDLRWVPAHQVSEGDVLVGFDEHPPEGKGNTRYWRPSVVEKIEERDLPCYRLLLEDGTKIVASAGHPWLTLSAHRRVWRTTENLQTVYHRSGRPTRIIKPLDVWDETRSYEAGYLAAAFDGEGYLQQRPHLDARGEDTTHLALGYVQRPNAMALQVQAFLDHFGFDYQQYTHSRNDVSDYTIKGGRSEILRFLGQIRPARLLDQFQVDQLARFNARRAVAVVECEPIGMHPIIGWQTSTRTFLAEGFASHNTGLRIHEAVKCDWPVPCPEEAYVVGKGDKEELMQIHPKAREAWNRLGGAWPVKARATQRRFEKAGFHPHQCRHWRATSLVRAGVEIGTVSKIMRHSSVATTMGYSAYAKEQYRTALDLVP